MTSSHYTSSDEKHREFSILGIIKVETPMPCEKGLCLEKAYVAQVMYSSHFMSWMLYPLCRTHSEEMGRYYQPQGGEGE